MAELIIKIGNEPNPAGFRDEDVVHAHNDTYLLWQATQRITDHRKLPGFFKPVGSLPYECLNAVKQYRFERLSGNEVKRIRLSDMSDETFSQTPNAKGEQIDVTAFVARRKAAGAFPMFGTEAAAIWFGGRTDASLVELSSLWSRTITPETGLLEADHRQKLPEYRPHFLKRFLVVVTDDFSDSRRATIEGVDLDISNPENPITVAMRKHKVVWSSLPGLSGQEIAAIANPNARVDVDRGTVRSQASIVEVK